MNENNDNNSTDGYKEKQLWRIGNEIGGSDAKGERLILLLS